MNWLTKEEVKAVAKLGEMKAVDCSIKHWTQLVNATEKELYEANQNYLVSTMADYCALCVRFECGIGCENCTLGKVEKCTARNSIWIDANTKFIDWRNSYPNKEMFIEWQIAATKMLVLLHKAKSKMVRIPKHGDKFYCKDCYTNDTNKVIVYMKRRYKEYLFDSIEYSYLTDGSYMESIKEGRAEYLGNVFGEENEMDE